LGVCVWVCVCVCVLCLGGCVCVCAVRVCECACVRASVRACVRARARAALAAPMIGALNSISGFDWAHLCRHLRRDWGSPLPHLRRARLGPPPPLRPQKEVMFAFSLGLNFCTAALWAVTYTFTPEVFPTELRTTVRRRRACRPPYTKNQPCMPPHGFRNRPQSCRLRCTMRPRGALAAS
jgi:hypothetical protein